MIKRDFRDRIFSGESLLLGSFLISNALNFLYNAYLGRQLSVEMFGVISLVNTLLYLLNMGLGALAGSINHQVAFIGARYGKPAADAFALKLARKLKRLTTIFALIWLMTIPAMMWYFHFSSTLPFVSFVPVVVIGIYGALARGYAIGSFLFFWTGAMYIVEAVTKCIFAFVIVSMGFPEYAYVSIPLSVCAASIVGLAGMRQHTKTGLSEKPAISTARFNYRFFTASLINNLATNAFLTFDVLLVTHYLSLHDAGIYGILALVGKMIFFFGTMLHIFVYSFVSRDEGRGINPNRNFYFILCGTIALSLILYLLIGPFGHIFLTLLFPDKARQILHLTHIYGAALVSFTIANTFAVFHLARKHYSFTLLSLFGTLSMLIGIMLFHQTIEQVVLSIFVLSTFYLVLSITFHFLLRNGGFLLVNLLDLISLLYPIPVPPVSEKSMRILIYNWRDTKHRYAGGAEQYIYECARRWVEQGNHVTLFCGNDGKCPRSEYLDGIQIIRRGGFYMVYLWAFLYYAFRFKGRFDVILDCENGIPFFTPAYVKEPKLLLIHHIHQDVFRKTLWKPLALFATFLELKLVPSLYRKIEFITVSPSTKAHITQHAMSTKEPNIVYNGVDITRYTPGEKANDPHILYLGRLKGYKSIPVVISAMVDILKKHPKARLTIAGDGEEKHSLHKLVQKLNIDYAVTFKGRVSEKEKIKLYQSAWVCVQPSFFEGWGITIIEANACGTPVVASRVEGLKDSVQDGKSGMLVPYGDSGAFAEAINRILSDKKLRDTFSLNCIQWARQFDWNTSANQALAIMQEQIDLDRKNTRYNSREKKQIITSRITIAL